MKVFVKVLKGIFIFLLALSVLYFSGPVPDKSDLSRHVPPMDTNWPDIDRFLAAKEAEVSLLKDDNEARVVWARPDKSKTPFSLIYLHGFSASQGEGFPIHQDFAKRYGCNLFLARLDGHGSADSSAMVGLTSRKLVESAKEAIAIGKKIGEKVIVMSTSTGSTLSLFLAAEGEPIDAMIMYSPNIAIDNKLSELITGPWGKQLIELSAGGNIISWGSSTGPDSLYWNTSYSIDGLIAMQDLIDQTMKSKTFEAIDIPVFMGYYYKNKEEKDHTVSVPDMQKMFQTLGTPDELKVSYAFPNAGRHVIASSYKSQDVTGVRNKTFQFAENILQLKPIEE
jgi:pimeloyl-ACP methyl ester carboxylesterase